MPEPTEPSTPPPTIVAADLTPAELWSLLVDLHRSGVPLPVLMVGSLSAAEFRYVLATLATMKKPLPVVVPPVVVVPGKGEGEA